MKLKYIFLGIFVIINLSVVKADAKVITDFDETKIQIPFVDSNEEILINSVCRTRENSGWDYCSTRYENGEEQMKSFRFTNWGENRIIPKKGFNISRDIKFMFEGFARSDLGMLIWDMPDEIESHGHLKLMMFFPRYIMPAIRHSLNFKNNSLIVTLPNKEEIIFDSKSKEVIGGVIKEGPIKQDQNGNAIKPDFVYAGTGVVLEANRLNDYPVGFKAQSKNNLATIKKKGHKDCQISVKNLWYTDDNKGGNVFFNKKYVTDESFDQLLREKCHFSMY